MAGEKRGPVTSYYPGGKEEKDKGKKGFRLPQGKKGKNEGDARVWKNVSNRRKEKRGGLPLQRPWEKKGEVGHKGGRGKNRFTSVSKEEEERGGEKCSACGEKEKKQISNLEKRVFNAKRREKKGKP